MKTSAALSRARWGSLERAPATSSQRSSRRAAMRWTAPMKAPRPPPTMPRRSLRRSPPPDLPSIVMAVLPGSQAQHFTVGGIVGTGLGEVVEGALGDFDDVRRDEVGSLGGSLLGVLHAALPLQHRPAVEAVLRQLGEDAVEIDLTVAERAEPAGPVDPGLIPAIDALPGRRVEFRVLGVEHADALVVDIDVAQVVELLEHEVAGVVQD